MLFIEEVRVIGNKIGRRCNPEDSLIRVKDALVFPLVKVRVRVKLRIS
jgi:hypothetical protein